MVLPVQSDLVVRIAGQAKANGQGHWTIQSLGSCFVLQTTTSQVISGPTSTGTEPRRLVASLPRSTVQWFVPYLQGTPTVVCRDVLSFRNIKTYFTKLSLPKHPFTFTRSLSDSTIAVGFSPQSSPPHPFLPVLFLVV